MLEKIINQFEPTVNLTIAFLKQLKVKVNDTTVNETLQNHPDWPTLLCIGDSLNKWSVPNGAGRISPMDVDELPIPFIAHVHNQKKPMVLVTKISETSVQYILKDGSKNFVESREAFLKNWTGVYLIAEPDENSGEKNYEANKQKVLLASLIPISLAVLLFTTGFSELYHAGSSIGIYIQYIIFLIGIVVTMLLLWYEIDKGNPLLQKICLGIAKSNCNAILSSKQAKVFSWLSWSEVGFFYFSGSLLTLLFVPRSQSVLVWLGILAFPYTVFSLYYQWQVAKQWCLLCLCVQALLAAGAINVLFTGFLYLTIPPLSLIIKSLTSFSVFPLLWYTFKPYILRLQEAKDTKREYLRIKFNTEIFSTLYKKQKKISVSTDGLGIDIGNPNATNTIVKVCNPYCGPCASAHTKLERLLEEIPNLKLKIIFFVSSEDGDMMTAPVKHLLSIAERNNESLTKKALDDWYHADKKDYNAFAMKYPVKGELQKQTSKIDDMYKWSRTLDVRFTPTFFLNGYQLHSTYNIEDLEYFLLD